MSPHAPPLVSVLMLTHNHAPYLQKAIASVQAQTWTHWELLIGEDASTDTTALIASAAVASHPERIQVLSSPEGALGFHRNFARLLARASGDYVAFLEGDDWWLEPTKLERQLSLLDADPSLAFCGARTRVVDERQAPTAASTQPEIGPPPGTSRLSFEQLIDSYGFHFSSVLMRREVVELPGWIFEQYCLDRPLYLLAASHGDAAVLDQVVSAYRLHDSGVWGPLSPLQKARRSRALFRCFRQYFPVRHRRRFRIALSHILWSYLADVLCQGQRREALAILAMGVAAAPGLRLRRQPRITLGALRRSLIPPAARLPCR